MLQSSPELFLVYLKNLKLSLFCKQTASFKFLISKAQGFDNFNFCLGDVYGRLLNLFF